MKYEIIASSLPNYIGSTIDGKDIREEMDGNASDVHRDEINESSFLGFRYLYLSKMKK